jgi:hypothetical protein
MAWPRAERRAGELPQQMTERGELCSPCASLRRRHFHLDCCSVLTFIVAAYHMAAELFEGPHWDQQRACPVHAL